MRHGDRKVRKVLASLVLSFLNATGLGLGYLFKKWSYFKIYLAVTLGIVLLGLMIGVHRAPVFWGALLACWLIVSSIHAGVLGWKQSETDKLNTNKLLVASVILVILFTGFALGFISYREKTFEIYSAAGKYFNEHKYFKALEAYETVLRWYGWSFSPCLNSAAEGRKRAALFVKCSEYLAEGLYDKAQETCQEILRRFPEANAHVGPLLKEALFQQVEARSHGDLQEWIRTLQHQIAIVSTWQGVLSEAWAEDYLKTLKEFVFTTRDPWQKVILLSGLVEAGIETADSLAALGDIIKSAPSLSDEDPRRTSVVEAFKIFLSQNGSAEIAAEITLDLASTAFETGSYLFSLDLVELLLSRQPEYSRLNEALALRVNILKEIMGFEKIYDVSKSLSEIVEYYLFNQYFPSVLAGLSKTAPKVAEFFGWHDSFAQVKIPPPPMEADVSPSNEELARISPNGHLDRILYEEMLKDAHPFGGEIDIVLSPDDFETPRREYRVSFPAKAIGDGSSFLDLPRSLVAQLAISDRATDKVLDMPPGEYRVKLVATCSFIMPNLLETPTEANLEQYSPWVEVGAKKEIELGRLTINGGKIYRVAWIAHPTTAERERAESLRQQFAQIKERMESFPPPSPEELERLKKQAEQLTKEIGTLYGDHRLTFEFKVAGELSEEEIKVMQAKSIKSSPLGWYKDICNEECLSGWIEVIRTNYHLPLKALMRELSRSKESWRFWLDPTAEFFDELDRPREITEIIYDWLTDSLSPLKPRAVAKEIAKILTIYVASHNQVETHTE